MASTFSARHQLATRRCWTWRGNGQNNEEISIPTLRDWMDFAGLTVNGLAIGEHKWGLVRCFHDHVINGLGAFVEVAPLQIDFPAANRRKLLREPSGPEIGSLPLKDHPHG